MSDEASVPVVIQVQAGITIALGVMGLAGAIWGLIGLLTGAWFLTQGAGAGLSSGSPGMTWMVFVSLGVQGVALVAGTLLTLGCLASGALVFLRGTVMPLFWTALGCLVYDVLLEMIWPVLSLILMAVVTMSVDPTASALAVGASAFGPILSVVVALVKAGFWGWTAWTVRAFRADHPDVDDAVPTVG